jgi:protease secretion system outer membrane protein
MWVSSSRQCAIATLSISLLLNANDAAALGLIEAYDAALKNDPAFQAAIFERQAGAEFREIGTSYLLPNVSANYSISQNQADIKTETAQGERSEERRYQSKSGGIQLRQPLFNLDAMARYRQGIAQTSASEAQFSSNSQDMMVRLVSLYVSAKYTEDQLAMAIAQRDAFAEQRKANDRLFKRGEGTVTDMIETQAKFDLAEAQVIEARDAVTNARDALASLIGREVTQLDPLQENFRAAPMQPASFEEWKTIALEKNPELVAQKYAVEAANQEIKKNQAGHAPRLDAVLGLNQSSSDTVSTYKQESTVNSIGLQLTIPLYAGGAIRAQSRQAAANYGRAQANLDGKTNDVLLELRKQYNASLNASARIDALIKSADSARLLIDATTKSVKAGLRTNLDSLNAQRQLFEVKRDLALARYNYLVSYLRLRKAAGILAMSDLQTVSGLFEASR